MYYLAYILWIKILLNVIVFTPFNSDLELDHINYFNQSLKMKKFRYEKLYHK